MQVAFLYVRFRPTQKFVGTTPQYAPVLDRNGNQVLNKWDKNPMFDPVPLYDEIGRPVSYEPAKWNLILRGRVKLEEFEQLKESDSEVRRFLDEVLQGCCTAGPDHPASLNLMLQVENEDEIPHFRRLLKRIFMHYYEEIGDAEDIRFNERPQEATVLMFPDRTAA